jgi:hypothetical protein
LLLLLLLLLLGEARYPWLLLLQGCCGVQPSKLHAKARLPSAAIHRADGSGIQCMADGQ